VTDTFVDSAFLVTSRFSLEVVAMDTPLEVSAVKIGYLHTHSILIAERHSYTVILSVCLSVCLSQIEHVQFVSTLSKLERTKFYDKLGRRCCRF